MSSVTKGKGRSVPGEHARLVTQTLERLRSHGAWATALHHGSTKGLPDIVACYRGRFIAIEVKVSERRARPLQRVQLDRLKLTGALVDVIHSAADVGMIFAIAGRDEDEALEQVVAPLEDQIAELQMHEAMAETVLPLAQVKE